MCERFTLAAPINVIYDHFKIGTQAPQAVFKPRYNIAPSQDIPVVVKLPDYPARQLAMMHWGLIPQWTKVKIIDFKLINVQAETISTKPAHRQVFKKRRCIIPADGYYEWKNLKGRKQPYYIHYHHGDIFGFAGLWEIWKEGTADCIYSVTIITTEADAKVGQIHERMPVILNPEHYDEWLDPENQDTSRLQELLVTDTHDLEYYPVSQNVNNSKNNGIELIEKIYFY
jgi:putative SOS response-associated peptidase YedK